MVASAAVVVGQQRAGDTAPDWIRGCQTSRVMDDTRTGNDNLEARLGVQINLEKYPWTVVWSDYNYTGAMTLQTWLDAPEARRRWLQHIIWMYRSYI